MPTRRDWWDLIRATGRAVGRKDISGLYGREWLRARDKLTGDHRDEIERKGGRIRRFFRTTNAVLFGVSKRLAPPRRLLFAAAFLALVLAMQGPFVHTSTEKTSRQTVKTTEYHANFDNMWLFVSILALGSLLAMELVDKINYRDELELARDLQASLIPRTLPGVPPWEVGAYNRIANTVGGDIYDFVALPDGRLAVLFGDASGHGMAAGLVMAVAHAAFRTQLDVDASPEAVFATLNRIVCRTGGPRAFFGCLYVVLSPDGTFRLSIAGHPAVLVLARSGMVRDRLGRGAYPLGIKATLSWPVEVGALDPGEALLLYSDGVSEARDATGREFGDERIEAVARSAGGLSAESLVGVLSGELRVFCGDETPEDDVSIAVIRRG
ncbi:MAG: PP2C family protein-serine/threonine phosphatase [Acidobacteriota bacterium]